MFVSKFAIMLASGECMSHYENDFWVYKCQQEGKSLLLIVCFGATAQKVNLILLVTERKDGYLKQFAGSAPFISFSFFSSNWTQFSPPPSLALSLQSWGHIAQ